MNNDRQIIHYQRAPHDYFSIDDDEEEIVERLTGIVKELKGNKTIH